MQGLIKSSKFEIKIQIKTVKFKHLRRALDDSVQEIWQYYDVNFDFDPKTPLQPCELFYHHANPQKGKF
jgi:hypothetical protein